MAVREAETLIDDVLDLSRVGRCSINLVSVDMELFLKGLISTLALRVTLTGNSEAWIENYRGILEYTGERILLQAKTCQVCLEGTRLSIDYYTNEDMKISGNISALRYLRE
jgi:sporulation protein YqfC